MDKINEVEEWLSIAKEDLYAAEFLLKMNPKPLEIICFHCQQSAEKDLKAFLINNEQIVKKTHNLLKNLLKKTLRQIH